jgi:hypothetical protein
VLHVDVGFGRNAQINVSLGCTARACAIPADRMEEVVGALHLEANPTAFDIAREGKHPT